jgi:ribosomal protein L37E
MDPTIGECDRCGRTIYKRNGEEFTMLKASHYIFENQTYIVQMMVCRKCSDSFFNRWTAGKGG